MRIMKAARSPFICSQCRLVRNRTTTRLLILRNSATAARPYSSSSTHNSGSTTSRNADNNTTTTTTTTPRLPQRHSSAPKPNIDIKHIRQNPELHEQNCLERNYKTQATYPSRILSLFQQWQTRQREGRGLRERSNALRRQIVNPATIQHEDESTAAATKDGGGPATTTSGGADVAQRQQYQRDVKTMTRQELLDEARVLKQSLQTIEEDEARLTSEMTDLACAIPNLTSADTPVGDEPSVLSYINDPHPILHLQDPPRNFSDTFTGPLNPSLPTDRIWHSHVHIGSELGILDFAGAAKTSGWGWYNLLDEGAQLEQALISYALACVTRVAGWRQVSPPSLVYSHMASACGYQPRDQNGETQTFAIAQPASASADKPERSLAATAEIPLAGMRAQSSFEAAELPVKFVGASRCFRAEAGARGADTKGLYRVHEFTKVEMFAWTLPDAQENMDVFDEMVDVQTEILSSLGLHCRVLEMPSTDLGASATRKIDIEAFFPSRAGLESGGWGEVTSCSICTDYQSRRLDTKVKAVDGKSVGYPWTVNGTALAVPRVLAAILENGWDEEKMAVTIPECLRPWMGGKEKIEMKHRLK